MKQNYLSIDILRILGVLFVFLTHFIVNCNSWMYTYSNLIDYFQNTLPIVILITTIETAIPLFLMISGYCNIKKIIFERNKYIRSIIKIYFPYILSICLYFITNVIVHEWSLKQFLILVISFDLPYMWYLGAYLFLLLIMPFLNKAFITLNKKSQTLILCILFAFVILPGTFNLYFGKIFDDFYLQGIDFVFYYLVGCYIKNIQYSKRKIYLLNIISFLVFLVYYVSLSYLQHLAITRTHFIIFLFSIVIFIDCIYFFKNFKENKYVSFVAKKTLFIYMLAWNYERLIYYYFGTDCFSLNVFTVVIFICIEFVIVLLMAIIFDKLTRKVQRKLEDKICMII